ncbi:MAG: carbamoyl-phosphate synthase large subunit [Planctomycetota bacterium]
MPKRKDINKVMIIGAGPIIIGQAAEFDYSGSQACRSLRDEGCWVILLNSNPATIQTDLEMADRIYIEPLTVDTIEKIIAAEKPDGILAGMGGQTALNLCSELSEKGILNKYNIQLLGTSVKAIALAEDRELFRSLMNKLNEPIPKSFSCSSFPEVKEAVNKIGSLPVIIRPAYTLGGTGSGIAHNDEELSEIVNRGLSYSRIRQVLVEECVSGWAEFEYEVMRDSADNCVIICNMENLDPMGIHTGESIVIAPAQTLNDPEHQKLRNASLKIIRALGIEGGCNIQFALNRATGDYRIIEVNPRVSRSSALASKATGYPIAKVSAKIAIGLTLDEIPNPITGKTYAFFEPVLDYVVLKIPRWPFDKFRMADKRIGTQMKSTGEVMAIGRNIEESLFKAIRSLDTHQIAFEPPQNSSPAGIVSELVEPSDMRLYAIAEAFWQGYHLTTIADLTKWNPFFLQKIKNIMDLERNIRKYSLETIDKETLIKAKQMGFSDEYLAHILSEETYSGQPCAKDRPRQNSSGQNDPLGQTPAEKVRQKVQECGIKVDYKMVDTCAAEFEAKTPYYYSTYTTGTAKSELRTPNSLSRQQAGALGKVLVIGSGPIRIGQGIEFDYASVQGAMAIRQHGFEAIMVNNNPETVSTDYDISDRLYFEPITFEDVMNIIEAENPDGIIIQFGGQTAINLAIPLQKAIARNKNLKTKFLGTQPEFVDMASDREKFDALLSRLNIKRPQGSTGFSFEEVREKSARIGYPVLVRPSYVLGGKGMEIVHNEKELEFYITSAIKVSNEHPVLVDKYLNNAIEIDVDAVSDGKSVFIAGIMEHIEEAGVHSGDAICVIPPQTLSKNIMKEIRRVTREITLALNCIGLINIQLAVKDDEVYIIEANPRASRTVPYVSKSIGIPIAKIATALMLSPLMKKPVSLSDFGLPALDKEPDISHISIKAPVFPFQKLVGVDPILGPEMKSTGEVMGIADTFAEAYYKAALASGNTLPIEGSVYITVRNEDKDNIIPIARKLIESGLTIRATAGTAKYLSINQIPVETIYRISERQSPNALSLMREGKIRLIINTPTEGSGPRRDGYRMRRLAIELGIPFISNIAAARAAVSAIKLIKSQKNKTLSVKALNDYFPAGGGSASPASPRRSRGRAGTGPDGLSKRRQRDPDRLCRE